MFATPEDDAENRICDNIHHENDVSELGIEQKILENQNTCDKDSREYYHNEFFHIKAHIKSSFLRVSISSFVGSGMCEKGNSIPRLSYLT